MSLNLPRIAAALNAYPWTSGHLTKRDGTASTTYCAIGALLRYAGVAQDHIACAEKPAGVGLWQLYGQLLQSEYGIPDEQTAWHVMAANDSASSQAEAIERVLRVLTWTLDAEAVRREASGPACTPPLPWACDDEWEYRPDDDAGSPALVL